MNTVTSREIEFEFTNGTFTVGGLIVRPELVDAMGVELTDEDVASGCALIEVDFDARVSDSGPGEVVLLGVSVGGVDLTNEEIVAFLGPVRALEDELDRELAEWAEQNQAEAMYDRY